MCQGVSGLSVSVTVGRIMRVGSIAVAHSPGVYIELAYRIGKGIPKEALWPTITTWLGFGFGFGLGVVARHHHLVAMIGSKVVLPWRREESRPRPPGSAISTPVPPVCDGRGVGSMGVE